MRKRAQSWMLFVIAVVLITLVYGGFAIAARLASGPDAASMRQDVTFSSFQDLGLSVSLGFFAGVMFAIIAAGMMGNEYSWNTLRPLVARSRSRASLLAAKMVALMVYALVFTLAMVVVVTGLYFVGSWIAGESAGFSVGVLGHGIVFALTLLYANAPYMALAFMLATVFRSNAAGIAGALGLSFIEQPIFALLGLASSFFESVSRWGVSYNAGVVSDIDFTWSDGGGRAVAILAVYTLLFLGIAYAVFTRRDVTSG
jgi:ABC-2 type transport system permease protein